jgi:hypothetical protein
MGNKSIQLTPAQLEIATVADAVVGDASGQLYKVLELNMSYVFVKPEAIELQKEFVSLKLGSKGSQ